MMLRISVKESPLPGSGALSIRLLLEGRDSELPVVMNFPRRINSACRCEGAATMCARRECVDVRLSVCARAHSRARARVRVGVWVCGCAYIYIYMLPPPLQDLPRSLFLYRLDDVTTPLRTKVLYCVVFLVYDDTTPFEPRRYHKVLSNVLCMLCH